MEQEINPEKYLKFQQSIENLEEQFRHMENEVCALNEKRLVLEKCNSNSTNYHEKYQEILSQEQTKFINSNINQREFDKLTKQVATLENKNKNLTDDLNEWKNAYRQKTDEFELFREKYLNAQQLAEDYHRKLEVNNLETSRTQQQNQQYNHLQLINEKLKAELKNFTHLPLILEKKQLQLDENISKIKLLEKTIAALSKDLEGCIVKCELLQKDMNKERESNLKLIQDKEKYQNEIKQSKHKYDRLKNENLDLLKSLDKMQFLEECLNSKTAETHEYCEEIKSIHEEHEKHIMRIKERTELQKRAFQSQISGLELEMVQLRTNLCNSFKDRDDMKQRMQNEIINLEQKFTDSQLEIENLKSHVDILKASYANMLAEFDNEEDESDGEIDIQLDENNINHQPNEEVEAKSSEDEPQDKQKDEQDLELQQKFNELDDYLGVDFLNKYLNSTI